MRYKKTAFLLLVAFGILPGILFAQKITYTYDSAGNRTSRQYTIVQLRSATNPKTNADDTIPVKSGAEDFNVTIYPNPTKSTLTVKVSGGEANKKMILKLLSPQGTQLQVIDASLETTQINMSKYPSGWYILRVFANDKAVDFKIIKE